MNKYVWTPDRWTERVRFRHHSGPFWKAEVAEDMPCDPHCDCDPCFEERWRDDPEQYEMDVIWALQGDESAFLRVVGRAS